MQLSQSVRPLVRWVAAAGIVLGGATVGESLAQSAIGPGVAVANDDTNIMTDEDTAVEITVLANDVGSGVLSVHVTGHSMQGGRLGLRHGMVVYEPAADFNGSDSFRYTLYEDGVRRDDALVSVTVRPVDDPLRWPRVSQLARSGYEGSPITFEVTPVDPDGPPGDSGSYTYSHSYSIGGETREVSGTTFSWTPPETADGVTVVTFKAQAMRTTIARYRVVVHERNAPPTLAAIPPATTTVGEAVTFTARGTDTDRLRNQPQVLTYALSGAPAAASINPASGAFTWTPTASDVSPTVFTVTVTDADGATAWQPVTVTVSDAPAVTGTAARNDWIATDEEVSVDIPVTGNDHGFGSSVTLALNDAVRPGNGMASVSNSGDMISYTPNADFSGTDMFEYTLTAGADSSTATVSVVVRPVNDAPRLEIDATRLRFPEGTSFTWAPAGGLAAFATDPDGGSLSDGTLVLDLESTPSLPIAAQFDTLTGTITWRPSEADDGTYALRLRLADPAGVEATHSLQLVIAEENQPPQLDPIAALSAVTQIPFRRTVTAVDVDEIGGVAQRLIFSLRNAPTGMHIDAGSGVITWVAPATEIERQVVTVVVTDAAGISDSSDAVLQVAGPTLQAAAYLAVNDQAVTDEDQEVLIPVLDNDIVPDGVDIDLSNAAPSLGNVSVPDARHVLYTPNANRHGLEFFAYELRYQGSVIGRAWVSVRVVSVEDLPEFRVGSIREETYVLRQRETSTNVVVEAIIGSSSFRHDADGDTIYVEAEGVPEGEDGFLTRQFRHADQFGVQLLGWITTADRRELSDGVYDDIYYVLYNAGGERVRLGPVRWEIVEVNEAPTFSTFERQQATAGSQFRMTAAATDPDVILGVPQVLEHSLIGAPSDMEIGAATGVITWTPSASSENPTEFSVLAQDPQGLIAVTEITVEVSGGTDADVASFRAVPDATSVTGYLGGLSGSIKPDVIVDVLANDVGASSAASVSVSDQAMNGTAAPITEDGRSQITYRPNSQFFGTDRFSYTVTEGGQSSTTDVDVVVRLDLAATETCWWMPEDVTETVNEGEEIILEIPFDEHLGLEVSTGQPDSFACGAWGNRPVPPGEWHLLHGGIYGDDLPSNAEVNAAAFTVRWTPNERQDGVAVAGIGFGFRSPNAISASSKFNRHSGGKRYVHITVNEVSNFAPVITPIASRSTPAGEMMEIAAVATDGDYIGGRPETMTWTLGDAPAEARVSSDGVVTWTPATADVGAHEFELIVTDTASKPGRETFTITVFEPVTVEQVPGRVSLSEPAPVNASSVSAVLIDPNGGIDNLDWQWQRADNADPLVWADIIPATSATYTVGSDDVGKRLRAVATYDDALNTGQRRASYPTEPVTLTGAGTGPAADTAAPTVLDVRISSVPRIANTFVRGEAVVVAVVFDEAVEVSGSPSVNLRFGNRTVAASYTGGDGSPALTFEHTVVIGDETATGIIIPANAVSTAGSTTIADAAGNAANLSHAVVEYQQQNRVDTTPPAVSEVSFQSTPADGVAYAVGEDVAVAVRFNEVVWVTGEPTLDLRVGANIRTATYAAGTETHTLTFEYEVVAGDEDADGIEIPANAVRTMPAAETPSFVRDQAGYAANLRHVALPPQRAQQAGRLGPAVLSVLLDSDPGSDRTYAVDDEIVVAVRFVSAVTVTGTPELRIIVGDSNRTARYAEGSGTDTARFTYVVLAGDHAATGVRVGANAIDLAGGSVRDAGGRDAVLTHGPLGAQVDHRVDTTTAAPERIAAVDDSATTAEEQSVVIDVRSNDPDAAGLRVDLSNSAPQSGTVELQGGMVRYAPAVDFHGTDMFDYELLQFSQVVGRATVTVRVTPVADPPVLTPLPATMARLVPETDPLTFTIAATDPDGDSLMYGVDGLPAGSVNPTTGAVSWQLAETDDGPLGPLTIWVSDGTHRVEQIETFHVAEVNSSPVLNLPSTHSVQSDGTLTVTARASDADRIGGMMQDLTFRLAVAPGTATIGASNGAVSWSLGTNPPAEVQFVVEVTDGAGGVDFGRMAVTVSDVTVGTNPVAFDDWARTTAGSPVTVSVLDNDRNVDTTNALTPDQNAMPANGTVSVPDSAGRTVVYTPAANFTGADEFGYTVVVGTDSASGTVHINVVQMANEAPELMISETRLSFTEGVPGDWTPPGDAAMWAQDGDGDSLADRRLGLSLQSGAPAGIQLDSMTGRIRWTPTESQDGEHLITMVLTDSRGGTDEQTLTAMVWERNVAPELPTFDPQRAVVGLPVRLSIAATDADAVGGSPQRLIYSLLDAPAEAKIDSASGVLSWIPVAATPASVRLRVMVADTGGLTDEGTIDFTVAGTSVTASGATATTAPDAAWTREDESVDVAVLDNDRSTLPLTVVVVADSAAHGQVTLHGNIVTYRPDPNFHGADEFQYVAYAGTEALPAETVTVVVTPVNDPPTLTAPPLASRIVREGEVMSFQLVGVDVDGDDLTYSLSGFPADVNVTPPAVENPPNDGFDPDAGTFRWSTDDSSDGSGDELVISVTDGTATTTLTGLHWRVFEVYTALDDQGIEVSGMGEPTRYVRELQWASGVEHTATIRHGPPDVVGEDFGGRVPASSRHYGAPPGLNFRHHSNASGSTSTITWTPPVTAVTPVHLAIVTTDTAGRQGITEYTIHVTGATGPTTGQTPVPVGDYLTIPEDGNGSVNLLANDLGDTTGVVVNLIDLSPDFRGELTLLDGLATYTPPPNFNGREQFEYFVVADGQPVIAEVAIIVLAVNDPPELHLSEPTVVRGAELSALDWSPPGQPADYATDVDGETLADGRLALIASGPVPVGLSLDPHTGRIQWTPGEDQDGTHSVDLQLVDDAGGTDTVRVRIVVGEVNTPPVLSTVSDRTVAVGEDLLVQLSVHDPDIVAGVPEPVTVRLLGLPAGAIFDADLNQLRWRPQEAADVGEHVLTAVATDLSGATNTLQFTISVRATALTDLPGTVVLVNDPPAVGRTLRAALGDENGAVTGVVWQWQRATLVDSAVTWDEIAEAINDSYVPTDSDLGARLRARVRYSDGHGSGKETHSVPSAPVLAAAAAPPEVPTADNADPEVVGIAMLSAPQDGMAYVAGEELLIGVVFSEAVEVVGVPVLDIVIGVAGGGGGQTARYAEGSGSARLIFKYTIATSDSDIDGVSIVANALRLPALSDHVQDGSMNAAILAHAALPDQPDHSVNGAAHSSTTVRLATPYTMPIRGAFELVATFSREVSGFTTADVTVVGGTVDSVDAGATVSGEGFVHRIVITPAVDGSLTVDVVAGAATDGNGQPTLAATQFRAVVARSDDRPGVVTVAGTPARVGAELTAGIVDPDEGIGGENWQWQSAATTEPRVWTNIANAMDQTYTPVTADIGRYLRVTVTYTDGHSHGEKSAESEETNTTAAGDAVVITAIEFVSDPLAGGRYGRGEAIVAGVTFNAVVDVEGVPQLTAMIGSTARTMRYQSGAGTMELRFEYLARGGDIDLDGISLDQNALTLPSGATIIGRRAGGGAGLPALLPHAARAADPTQLVYAPETPRPGTIAISGQPARVGNVLTASITDANSGINVNRWVWQRALIRTPVNWVSIPDSNMNTFTPRTADAGTQLRARVDYVDASGTATQTAVSEAVVVTLTPSITAVSFTSSPAADTGYVIGESITVAVDFSHPVRVVGNPRLGVEIGSVTHNLPVTGGSGTSTLQFTRRVVPGDVDVDGMALAADSLVIGTGDGIQGLAGATALTQHPAVAMVEQQKVNAPAVDLIGSVTLSSRMPRNGQQLTAVLSDGNGATSGEVWLWQRAALPSAGTDIDANLVWTDISTAISASYSPASTDVGQVLRATVTYNDPIRMIRQAASLRTAPVIDTGTALPSTVTVTMASATVPVVEGMDATTSIVINLSRALTGEILVPFQVESHPTLTAVTEGEDYAVQLASASPITLSAGATTGRITFNIRNDTVAEGPEGFRVTLGNPISSRGDDAPALGANRTTDVEIAGGAQNDVLIAELTGPEDVTEGRHTELYTISLRGGVGSTPIDVQIEVDDMASTVAAGEYTLPAAVQVAAGQSAVSFAITLGRDADGDDERLVVNLASAATQPIGRGEVAVSGAARQVTATVEDVDTVRAASGPPSSPTGLRATAAPEQVSLTWSEPSDTGGVQIQRYRVERSLTGGTAASEWAELASDVDPGTRRYVDRNVQVEFEPVYYRVAALNSAGAGNNSISASVVAIPGVGVLDFDDDEQLTESDALIMYYAYALRNLLGDGREVAGMDHFRQTFLGGLADADATQDELRSMLRVANDLMLYSGGENYPGDINGSGDVDERDALILYYSFALSELVGDGERSDSGFEDYRRALLRFQLPPGANDDDAALRALIRRAREVSNQFDR